MSLYSSSTYDRVKKLAPIVAGSVGRSLSGAEIEALAREAATSAPSSQRDQVLWLRGRLGGGQAAPLPTPTQAAATVAAQQAAGPPRAITPPGGVREMSLVATTRMPGGGGSAPAVSGGFFGTLGGILKGAAGGLLAGGPVGGILGGIAGGIGASGGGGGQAVPTSPPIAPGGGAVAGLGGVFPTVPLPPQQAPTTRRTVDLTPLPGAIYSSETTMPALPAGPASEPPRGYRLNKTSYFLRDGTFVPKGTRWVKVRRRNAMNPRALSRAIARVDSAKRWQSKLSGITTRKYTSSGSRKSCK